MSKQRQMTILLVFFAILFGAYVRLTPVIQAGFPINDGGLFYSMTQDLVQAGFLLPETTSFNQLNIPYAYPPLQFYFAGLISIVSKIPILEIIHWLPLIFSLLTIPAFFLLASSILESADKGALATVIYALLPRSYDWLIMGGGLTRAPSTLFFILMAWATYRTFKGSGWKMVVLAAFFGSLILLTHPERSLHAAVMGLLFWIWLGRSRTGTLKAIVIGLGSLLLSSPWWATIILREGGGVFLHAARSGGSQWLFWAPLFQLNFTDEAVPIIAVLSVIGMFTCWSNKKGLLPLWFILTFLIDPRSAPHIIAIQSSLLAALTLTDLILPAISKLEISMHWLETLSSAIGRVVLGYLVVVMLFNIQSNLATLDRYILSPTQREAIDWASQETPTDSHFLVLGWQELPMLSPVLEWFPALSGRVNIVTVQGREWLSGNQHFSTRLAAYKNLFACHYQESTCLADWAKNNEETFDYVFLSLEATGDKIHQSSLSNSLLNSNQYELVYTNSRNMIFKHLP